MKKILLLILTAALMLSLAACGGKSSSMTKEEMLEVAEVVSVDEVSDAVNSNIVNAKQAYCGKVLEVQSTAFEIEEDRIDIGHFIVYLPEEDIAKIQKNQRITVVGKTNDDIQTETSMALGGEVELKNFVMEEAYLVTDRYEFTGTIWGWNSDFSAWDVKFPNNSILQLVYFEDGTDVEQYVGTEITFSAQVIDGDYHNAVITQQ